MVSHRCTRRLHLLTNDAALCRQWLRVLLLAYCRLQSFHCCCSNLRSSGCLLLAWLAALSSLSLPNMVDSVQTFGRKVSTTPHTGDTSSAVLQCQAQLLICLLLCAVLSCRTPTSLAFHSLLLLLLLLHLVAAAATSRMLLRSLARSLAGCWCAATLLRLLHGLHLVLLENRCRRCLREARPRSHQAQWCSHRAGAPGGTTPRQMRARADAAIALRAQTPARSVSAPVLPLCSTLLAFSPHCC